MARYDSAYHHTRNYGCRHMEIGYRGYRALVVTVDLTRGGKREVVSAFLRASLSGIPSER